ncbi:MAG: helix-turn-helix domain-containing protein [Bacilli bacterium]|nr:helix-turn-helix domain-containing protein [Bacilli bacterium]
MNRILRYLRYNTREVAKVLGISEKTVRSYFRSGRLQGFKDGRRWYTTETALDKYEFMLFCEEHNIEYEAAINLFIDKNGDPRPYPEILEILKKGMEKNDAGNSNIGNK